MPKGLIWIFVGMGAATYLPRLLPLVLLDEKKIPPRLQAVLKNIPFAMLGALIMPGVFNAGQDIWYGLLGAAAAFAAAYWGLNLILVVVSSIGVLFLYLLFF